MYKFLFIFLSFMTLLFAQVNINTADKKELMTLEGIGAKKAEAIIEYRSTSKFNSIEDLKKVKGIGDKLFDKIKTSITVDSKTPQSK